MGLLWDFRREAFRWELPKGPEKHWWKGCWIRFTDLMRTMTMKQYSPMHIFGNTKTPAFFSQKSARRNYSEHGLGSKRERASSTTEHSKTNCWVILSSAVWDPISFHPEIVTRSQQSTRRESESAPMHFFLLTLHLRMTSNSTEFINDTWNFLDQCTKHQRRLLGNLPTPRTEFMQSCGCLTPTTAHPPNHLLIF